MRFIQKTLSAIIFVNIFDYVFSTSAEFDPCKAITRSGALIENHPRVIWDLGKVDEKSLSIFKGAWLDAEKEYYEHGMGIFENSPKVCTNLKSWQDYQRFAKEFFDAHANPKIFLDETHLKAKYMMCAKQSLRDDSIYLASNAFYDELTRKSQYNDKTISRLIYSIKELRVAGAEREEMEAWAESIINKMNISSTGYFLKKNSVKEKIAEVYDVPSLQKEDVETGVNPCLIKLPNGLSVEDHEYGRYWEIGGWTHEMILIEREKLAIYKPFPLQFDGQIPEIVLNLRNVQTFRELRQQFLAETSFSTRNRDKFDLEVAKRQLRYLLCAKVLVENDPMLMLILQYKHAIVPDRHPNPVQIAKGKIISIIKMMGDNHISIEELKKLTIAFMTEYDTSFAPLESKDIMEIIDSVYL